MSLIGIVLLVAVSLGVLVVVLVSLWSALARRASALRESLRAEVAQAGEVIELGPESGLYRGSNAPALPRVKGNAVLVLTDRRLCIRPLVGRAIDVERARIVGVREDKWFLGAMTSLLPHVILALRDGGEVGIIVAGEAHATWLDTFRKSTGG